MRVKCKLVLIIAILWAGPAMAQDTLSITLSFQNIALKEVMIRLTNAYNLKFSYSEDMVELNRPINLSVRRSSLNELLQQIFSQANVEYNRIGDQIVIRKSTSVVVVKGKVVDNITGVPLPFASIGVEGTGLGTATNNEGIFVLTVPSHYINGKLIISYVGYKRHVITLTASERQVTFRLVEDVMQLPAAVVTDGAGYSILGEAISRIRQNYDTSDVRYTYFIRDISLLDEVHVGASEVLYEAYRGSVNNSPVVKQVKFRNGRKIKDFQAVQRILQTFIRWTGFELGFDSHVIFTSDLTLQRDDGGFPSVKFMTQHNFELLGVSQLDSREVYIIDFDQKPGVKKSLYKGRFYIDVETMAFSRIEIGLSPRGIEQARFFNTPRAMAALFGFGKCAVTAKKTSIQYKPINGKWYPATMEEYWSAALVQSKKEFYSTIELKGNIVITDIQTENIVPFNKDEVLTDGYRNWEYLHRSSSPFYLNVIETDTDIRNVFHSIADQNKLQGIDMKFWRRYQPYKNDPSLLIRDSLRCQQAEIFDQGSLEATTQEVLNQREGNAGRAKYPLLNKSFSTQHFKLYYLEQDSSSALEVSEVLENNYTNVLTEFQLKNLDTTIHVEIYPDVKHYHFAIGKFEAPDSDAGMAVDLNLFKMVSPGNPGSYHTRESLLKAAVHEFAHCVHYHFIERLRNEERARIINDNEAPWLFEAVASYTAGQFYDPARLEYMVKKQHPTIQILNEVEPDGKIYALGFVIIEFIKQKWGQEGLITLLKKNGNIFDSFNMSENEFETELYRYIDIKYLTDNK